jgi:UDP-N-acetylmuramyl pentapeptide phosphotransferase/UDP-N-acetylglucosamine-1-phosphate transferase
LLPFITSFLICFILTPAVIRFASERRWFDKPDERKHHASEIPRLGGVAIMGSLIISILLVAGPETILNTRYFLAGLLILFFVGLWDDLQPARPVIKLLGEFIPVILLTYFARIPLADLFPQCAWISTLEWPFTIFMAFWAVNAYNLIDGINGLAGTLGLIAMLGMGITGTPDVYHLCISMAGALLAFLFYNFLKPRIFMGDGGSLPVGYLLAFSLTQLNHTRLDILPSMDRLSIPLTAFSLMSLPLFDMARVFFIRLQKKKNPFKGDRNHLHHLLLETGLSHVGATIQLTLLSLLTATIVLSTFILNLDPLLAAIFAITVMALVPLIFTAFLWKKVKRNRNL